MEAHKTQHIDQQILALMNSATGTEPGMRLLMNTYQERLYWHIRGLVKTHQDTDDVLQNTFVKVFRHIPGFKGNSQLYTWLYRIATNESLSLLRSNQRKGVLSLDDELIHRPQLLAEEPPQSDRIRRALSEALEGLPDKQRAVFQLRYYDELSYQDIKEITGTSVGALKASYHHAVKKIELQLRNAEL